MYNSYNRGGGWMSVVPATMNIIIINVLLWVMKELKPEFMIENFALFYPTSPYFRIWQPLTHMFMHGDLWHIFFNMYTLFIFGSALERIWGSKKFLVYYFVTGFGAALLHTGVMALEAQYYLANIDSMSAQAAYHTLKMTPTVGASGAIYGLLLGYAMLFPNSVLTLIFPPISLKAKWFVIIFAVIELVLGVFSPWGGIAHFAHLGGMLFGWLLIRWWKKHNRMY